MSDDEDPDDGAPPIDSHVRMHVNPSYAGPHTPEEIERFGIRNQAKAPTIDLGPGLKPSGGGDDARFHFLTALAAKLPEFNPTWEPKVQEGWFAAFERLLGMGKA